MEFALCDEHRMIKELVRRFVDTELVPLEGAVLAREAAGQDLSLLKIARDVAKLAKISYVRQPEALGLGHAVLMAKEPGGR